MSKNNKGFSRIHATIILTAKTFKKQRKGSDVMSELFYFTTLFCEMVVTTVPHHLTPFAQSKYKK